LDAEDIFVPVMFVPLSEVVLFWATAGRKTDTDASTTNELKAASKTIVCLTLMLFLKFSPI
jgi:hypothetical protein